MNSATYSVKLQHVKMFITIARKDGAISFVSIHSRSPMSDIQAQIKAFADLLNLAFSIGATVEQVSKCLKGIQSEATYWEGVRYLSIPDAIGQIIEQDEKERVK